MAEFKAAVKNAAFLRRVRPQLDASDTDDLNALAASLVKKPKADGVKEEKHAKPAASRKGSSEWYVVAQGYKGG